jgi:hypothetical protein
MTIPARDAALAAHEQGTGSPLAGTRPSQSPAPVDAAAVIAQLRRRVRIWMDGDQILPAEGSFLLAALDQVLAELTQADAPAVPPLGPGTHEVGGARREPWAGIEQFVEQVRAQTGKSITAEHAAILIELVSAL